VPAAQVPARYTEPFAAIADPSRRTYAGMLAALDEGLANISSTLLERRPLPGSVDGSSYALENNAVLVLSNDNGGMSGTYGLGCCICGTSCGGLKCALDHRRMHPPCH
jgi:hypothetical protein